MKEETGQEVQSRREMTVRYSRISCIVGCLILMLNIGFVIYATVYVAKVRLGAAQEIDALRSEIISIRKTVTTTKQFVFNTIAPTQELLRRQLDTNFSEDEDED